MMIFKQLCRTFITASEYGARRDNLLKLLLEKRYDNVLILVPSASVVEQSVDVPYPFRQDSNFRYLTGFPEPSSLLSIFLPHKAATPETILFVEERTFSESQWKGFTLGCEKSSELTNIPEVRAFTALDAYIEEIYESSSPISMMPDTASSSNKHAIVNVAGKVNRICNKTNKRFLIENISPYLDKLRLIKSSGELQCLAKAGNVIGEALSVVFEKLPKHYSTEDMVKTELEYQIQKRGASVAFPPVVAAGNNATCIHHLEGKSPIKTGSLLLIDSGASIDGYMSDVTRVWPVDGELSPAQRVIYGIVKGVFQRCCNHAQLDMSLSDLHAYMVENFARLLVAENIISSDTSTQMARKLCPHSVGHFLGLDVHDSPSIPSTLGLQPGHVFTVEPGLYFPRQLTHDPIYAKIPKDFFGIGIRLENDFYFNSDGSLICLSHAAPFFR